VQKQLEQIVQIARDEIHSASNPAELANLKSKYLGKNSHVTDFLKRLRELPQEERPAFGAVINEAKRELEELINIQEKSLVEQEYTRRQEASRLDLTLPGHRTDRGALHPLTQVWREIEDNFISLGFEIAEGFDVEDQFHNFDALNTPKDHPSRNLADTFFITENTLLRTQTSTVQVRTMESYKPPIRIISPGRCYRNDKLDASHSPVFHQVEALVVDEGITFADLRDTLNQFAAKMFGPGTKSRFRPHFFPFTEPSAEMDISCVSCGGRGCRICKGSGWLEMGGAGMVDPNVFEILGIDPERYSGFAFGLGIDRIAMLKFNLPDIRLLFENDLRFLRQFR
jgi:phenylalanyl-tRNA synthetase alpha chain